MDHPRFSTHRPARNRLIPLEISLITCVFCMSLLIWTPVFRPNLLMTWRISDIGLIVRQVLIATGMTGVLYFSWVSSFHRQQKINWLLFLFHTFLGFSTFGLQTLGYFIFRTLRRLADARSAFPYQAIISPKPKHGLWWAFSNRHWSPNLLDALKFGESPHVSLAVDGKIIWQENLNAELHQTSVWIAENVVKNDSRVRSTPPYFFSAIQKKKDWLSSAISDQRFIEYQSELTGNIGKHWPSNWCTASLATCAMADCFRHCLEMLNIQKHVYNAAILRTLHARALERCRILECDLTDTTLSENVHEHEFDGLLVRSIDCPGISDREDLCESSNDKLINEIWRQQNQYLTRMTLAKMLDEEVELGCTRAT